MSCPKWASHAPKLKISNVLNANEIGEQKNPLCYGMSSFEVDSSGGDVGGQACKSSRGGILGGLVVEVPCLL